MTDNDDDTRDPLRAAFADYQRPPPDIVPRRPHGLLDDLVSIAGTMAEIEYYTFGSDGVTKHTERTTITEPFTPKGTNQ